MNVAHAPRWCMTVLFSIVAVPMARGEAAIAVRVTPNTCHEGCSVRVTVRIEPDTQNRVLIIEADSPAYFRASEIQLGGESAPLLHTLMLRSPPAEHYIVRATVVRANGSTQSSRTQLLVLGPPDELSVAPDS